MMFIMLDSSSMTRKSMIKTLGFLTLGSKSYTSQRQIVSGALLLFCKSTYHL